MYTVQFMYR